MSKKEEKIFSIADYPVRTGVHFIREKKGGRIYQTRARAPNKSELAAMGFELLYEFEIKPASEAELILKWARCGDWNSLADYLADGGRITDAIRVFLIEVLRQQAGKPNNRAASLRTLDAPRWRLASRAVLYYAARRWTRAREGNHRDRREVWCRSPNHQP
jgi:hypothetical protein